MKKRQENLFELFFVTPTRVALVHESLIIITIEYDRLS